MSSEYDVDRAALARIGRLTLDELFNPPLSSCVWSNFEWISSAGFVPEPRVKFSDRAEIIVSNAERSDRYIPQLRQSVPLASVPGILHPGRSTYAAGHLTPLKFDEQLHLWSSRPDLSPTYGI